MWSCCNPKQPCNNDSDIRSLISSYRGDDELAFDRLVEIYRPLTESMVSEFEVRLCGVYDRDDINQYALIAFSKAVLTYDLEQSNVSFGLYAKVCIENALVSRTRATRRSGIKFLSIDGLCEIADPFDVSRDLVDRENTDELRLKIDSTLSDFESKVFWLFVSGYSVSEISHRLKKSEKSIGNAIFRARSKLKAVLNETIK